MAGFVNSITISTWISSPTILRSSSSVGKISASSPPPIVLTQSKTIGSIFEINFWNQKYVVSQFSMAKIKWRCKCYWWVPWKETNLFMVVYCPLFQCSLQSCWTGIQFLGFINHSQKWPPRGSIYSAFCGKGGIRQITVWSTLYIFANIWSWFWICDEYKRSSYIQKMIKIIAFQITKLLTRMMKVKNWGCQ